MEGTPIEFLEEVRRFGTHKKNKGSFDDPVEIGLEYVTFLQNPPKETSEQTIDATRHIFLLPY